MKRPIALVAWPFDRLRCSAYYDPADNARRSYDVAIEELRRRHEASDLN